MGLFSGEREQWELLGQNAILEKQKAFSQVEFIMRQTHRTLLPSCFNRISRCSSKSLLLNRQI